LRSIVADARGDVERAAGPWRTSGAWWDGPASAWDRDEWDAALSDGSVCRLFRDRITDGWFLDGIPRLIGHASSCTRLSLFISRWRLAAGALVARGRTGVSGACIARSRRRLRRPALHLAARRAGIKAIVRELTVAIGTAPRCSGRPCSSNPAGARTCAGS
jgi:hypothetical protein